MLCPVIVSRTWTDLSMQSRSFTGVPNTGFADSNKNGTSSSLTAPWEKTIWSFDSVSKRDIKPDAPKLRDYNSQGTVKQSSVEKKSGSGMLLEGSQAWNMRSDSNNRPFAGMRPLDTSRIETRQPVASAPHQTCLSPTEKISPVSARPPTINLTTSDFTSRMGRTGFSSHESKPPALFTKFSATAPIVNAPTTVDSAHTSVSPTETRMPFWATPRDPSQPPSRHSNHEPTFSESTQSARMTPASTRNHSFSSQRNANYSAFHTSIDQIIPQFGQMSFGQNGHAAALRKASEPWNGQSVQRTPQYPSKYGSFPFNNKDDIEEIGPHGVSYITSDDTAMTQSNDYSRFSNIRFGQAPAPIDFLHGNAFAECGATPRSQDFANSLKLQSEWASYAEDMGLSREFSAMSEQQAILDPRLQHMIRVQYQPTMYNPYALSNGLQSNGSGPYLQMYGIGGLENAMPPRETLVSEGVQSTKLYDFKNAGKNNKRWELSDIFDHIAEFAGDQYGSRFIQTKLETANSDEKERVFREIEPNSIPLMTDVFGNYVIQKFFDHGHQEHKKLLANKMRGQVLTLSLQMYGCRVVQKALEHVLVEQQAALVGELENHVLKCVKDQNGNHVIQKAIERCAPETIGLIYRAFIDQVQHLSLHPYGCRVIQRCLERPEWFPAKPRILTELHASMQQGMIADQYGNYVVQHVVQKGEPKDKAQVFRLVIAGLEGYSKHKFASNVVEKCIEYSDDLWRREVVNVLTAADQRRSEGDTTLVSMIKDNFGNYVIRKLPTSHFAVPILTHSFRETP
jgi:hypothetical protein